MNIYANVVLGWTPILAVAQDGNREVLEVTGWTGGSGTAPATGVYVGSTGYVTDISLAVDIRGDSGAGVDIQVGTNVISSGVAVFSNSNNITFGMSGSTITASVAAGNINLSAGSTSNNLTNFQFNNSNGISFGLNGSTVTATVATNYQSQGAYLTTAMQSNAATISNINLSAGTTSNNLSAFTLANSNGISFGLNGSILTGTVKTDYQTSGNYLTTAMASNASSNFVQATAVFAGTNASGTIASNGISVSVNPPDNGVAVKGSGTYTQNTGTIEFANSNGITFGLSNNGTLTASHNGLTTQTNQNISLFALGNTTQNSSTLLNASNLSFNAIGSITLGYSNGSIQVSAPNALTTARASTDAIGLNTAQTNVTWTVNSSGISLDGRGYAGTGTSATNISLTLNSLGLQASVALPNISAGTTSNNLQSVVFANANGISFGLGAGASSQSITASHNALTTAMASNAGSNFVNTSAGLNLTNVSATLASNSLSISVGNYITTARASTDAVGLNTALTANGVSWTVNSSGISLNVPAFLTTAALSNHSHGVSFTSGSTVFQTLSFTNSNGISFNSGTQGIFASHNALTTAAQSNQVVNSLNGSTGQISLNVGSSLSASSNGSSITFGLASNITTALQSTGNYLTTARASTDAAGLNTAKTNVTWTVNSSGISLDGGLYLTSQTNQSVGLYALGNTTQNSSTTLDARSLSFNGLGIITAGYSNGSIQISATQSVQTQSRFNLTLSGNSTSGGAGYQLVSSGVLSLAGGNNITISQDGYALTISGANAGGAQTAISGMALSNTTYTSGTVSFRDLNGISWQSSTGQAIQITHDLQYTSNTSNITSNALNTSVSSKFIQNWKLTGNTAGTSSSAQGADLWLAGGNGLTISGSSNTLSFNVNTTPDQISLIGNTAGTTTYSINNDIFNFSGGNNITLSGNNSTLVFSVGNYITTARASTDAIGLNTAQSNVTWTVNSSGLSLDARGYAGTGTSATNASITLNSNGLQISVAAPGGGGAVNFSGGTTSANLQSVVFANANNATFGLNTGASSQSLTVSAPVNFSAGTTSNNLTQVSFANSNQITFGLNAGTVTASYQEPLQSYYNNGIPYAGTTAFTLGASSVFVQPFQLPYPISASYIRIANSWAFGSTTGGTTANTSLSLNNSQSIWVNIFSKGVGANSKSLQFVAQGSASLVFQVRAEIGAASNNQTVSHNYTYPSSEGAAAGNFATNYNVNSASYNISTTHLTSFNGFRWLDIPFATSLSAGAYWIGIAQSTATATTGAVAAMQNVTARNTFVAVSQISTNIAVMGVSSNMSTAPWANGLGYWSTNSNGTSSSSMGLASISTVANQPILPFQLIREV